MDPSRRSLLRAAGMLALAPGALHAAAVPEADGSGRLRAAPATLAAAGQAALSVWAYEEQVPGPALRLRHGQTLDLWFDNGLPDPSTVHWHGLRLPNPMDGVPHLTQPPVAPGSRFRYRFELPDAGTFWYHPHWGTPEQVDRGLAGALVVEEDDPPPVDSDLVWVIDDWRLDREGRIAEDFYDDMDASHAGRLGRTLTVNGEPSPTLALRAGQRVRLRLVNAANARIFALAPERNDLIQGWVLALDGAPLETPRTWDAPLLLGPGMRADLIIDALGAGALTIVDRFGRGARPLASLRIEGAAAVTRRGPPGALPPGTRPEPALADAQTESITLGGGMMSMDGWPEDSWTDRVARRLRRLNGSREASPAWTLNRRAHMAHGSLHAGEFRVPIGRTVRLRWVNRTAWWHPMHLHGHHFRLISRNRRPVHGQPWHDTVLLAPRDEVEVAYVADNPGRWLIHCHVLEHHAAGMGTVFDVVA